MAQLNEFVRTFSANVNQIQNTGYDLYQEKGCDLFVAAPLADGTEYEMAELLYNKTEGSCRRGCGLYLLFEDAERTEAVLLQHDRIKCTGIGGCVERWKEAGVFYGSQCRCSFL